MLGLASIVAIAVAGSIVILAVPYLAPDDWRWLSESQLTPVRTFVFSSVVAGGATSYFQTHSSMQFPQGKSWITWVNWLYNFLFHSEPVYRNRLSNPTITLGSQAESQGGMAPALPNDTQKPSSTQ